MAPSSASRGVSERDGGVGSTARHSYSAWGNYIITLTVTDDGGATGTQSKPVSLVNTPPVASFTLRCSSRTCTVNGSGSSDADGPIASFAWNFGDGTAAASGQTGTHTYSAAGSYTATLTVIDDGGATALRARR